MSQATFLTSQIYGVLPSDKEGTATLAELALDMRWSWNHSADGLWQRLDPGLWDLTHNPWLVLQSVSRGHLEKQLADPSFRKRMDELLIEKNTVSSAPAWFQQNYPDTSLSCVAYFSMEFMLSGALPIYVGGLGNVGGDQLKSASDLGIPIVGVGLLYQQGYFRQGLDGAGYQQASFPYNDPGQLPITPLRLPDGELLRLRINLAGHHVWLRTWLVQVGRVRLYLMDSNDAANLPAHREITNELYGGGADLRIKQEFILGVGGWKLLRALGIHPEVCHMNEGHSAFLILERASDFMKQTGVNFQEALVATRAGNLFTTHTAVAAGFDNYSPYLMEQFLGKYILNELKIEFKELMGLGRINPENTSEYFNMAFLAIRGSAAVNGVSSLHGAVSRKLFSCLFPRWPENEVPVGSVTNGVHMPSWDSEFADGIWTKAGGKDRWRGDLQTLEADIRKLPDDELWSFRNISRNSLVSYIRKRFERQLADADQPPAMIERAATVFNGNVLTIGFARRFVAYKRPNLLLHDKQRLVRMLTDSEQPVQLVIAGKAPPYDEQGKQLIQEWVQFIQQNNLFDHVVFLSDYDMLLAENLVQGVDVWVNTPRRPWEACGTSGMKVLVNGGINLSELDGWWAEAYTPKVGWALGDVREHGDDPAWDAVEAGILYDILEKQVIPAFYDRDLNDIPIGWVERMRESMATLTPVFSANRTVREYTQRYYLPAAEKYTERSADNGLKAKMTVQMQRNLAGRWKGIKYGETKIERLETGFLLRVCIHLNGIDPDLVLVQLFAEDKGAGTPITVDMTLMPTEDAQAHFEASVISERPASDFTPRVLPRLEGIHTPLETSLISWQR